MHPELSGLLEHFLTVPAGNNSINLTDDNFLKNVAESFCETKN